MMDERSALPDTWCISDDSKVHVKSQLVKVPCAVYEVKQSGIDELPFVQELEQQHLILDGYKFSKYLTGAAVFNSDSVSEMPYWASMELFKPIFNPGNLQWSQPSKDAQERQDGELQAVDPAIPCHVAPSRKGKGKAKVSFINAGKDDRMKLTKRDRSNGINLTNTKFLRFPVSKFNKIKSLTVGRRDKRFAQKNAARIEPKSFFANERTFIQW
eukprot:CAMPEP_0113315302 /NCGR_PEP_ID=MMETSP0010_2-20120614/11025_1 /TAXON_ID=216773 ORGANISM="Corethron hystrix, Strain 308" /NCGR_SAMPLE_ID=MMETSP0010_2 /ASSEMBLY_ACC=CAM_ASM_000155 /LENGTH=213 /DNA_ID=CAMNT_0000171777 /DNA_START=239 /DNA_END=877 /DNA_ORIENTATION=+ /assembly_acc=CAM_ASM_000155